MQKKISVLCVALLTLSGVNLTSPAYSMSIPTVKMDAGTNIIDVQYRRGNRGFYHHNGHGYYNGHRGHRTPRHGWRSNNGWWFPPAAFITGIIIGGALSNDRPPPVRYRSSLPNSHVSWCLDRYRSYRVSDNSFQPYNGSRRQCRSPYY